VIGHLAAAGAASLVALHAGPALTTVTPLRRRMLPALAGLGDRTHVALTFDDGPDPRSTPQFLTALRQLEVKATFFVLGRMLAAAPGLGRDLVAEGHEIAVHGWHHRLLLTTGPARTYDDLARSRDLIADITGTTPRWFRPPYGVLTGSALHAARRLDLTPVLWTTWGRDWTEGATPMSVLRTGGDRLAGGTVLLHDSDCTSAPGSWRATLGAVGPLVRRARDQNLTIGSLRDHETGRLTASSR
jgi:peptidoglycan/xylan/chitin deacetylase (PgdA/CDA1 family)